MRTLRACKEVFDRQAGDEGLAPGSVGVALKELGVTADDPAVAQLVELSLAEAAAEMGGWGRTASNLACGASTTAAAGMAGATEAEEQKEQGEEGEAATAAALSYKEFIVLFRNVYAPANRFGADLRRAAGRGEVGAVCALLARGCNPNCRDGAGWTSLQTEPATAAELQLVLESVEEAARRNAAAEADAAGGAGAGVGSTAESAAPHLNISDYSQQPSVHLNISDYGAINHHRWPIPSVIKRTSAIGDFFVPGHHPHQPSAIFPCSTIGSTSHRPMAGGANIRPSVIG